MTNRYAQLKKILDKIEKQKGMITPQDVVEEARPITSPIHEMFDWNDTSAAEKYRLWQARQYIKDVTVEFVGKVAQGFFNVTVEVENVKTQGYFNTATILSDEAMRKIVLKDALAKLLYWQKLYKDFSELANIIDNQAIDDLSKSL